MVGGGNGAGKGAGGAGLFMLCIGVLLAAVSTRVAIQILCCVHIEVKMCASTSTTMFAKYR